MILLVQFRDDPSGPHEQDCVKRQLLEEQEIKIVSVFDESIDFSNVEELLNGVDRVILGGSGAISMAKGHEKVNYNHVDQILEKMKPLMEYILENDFLCLGSCFGHQLIGKFLGEEIVFDKETAETGIFEISLTNEGKRDRIFNGVPEKFLAIVGHQDSVKAIPRGCVQLAQSERCLTHGYRYKSNVYGTQFHGELNTDDLIYRLKLFPVYKKYAESIDYKDTSNALIVLKNFLKLERI